MKRNWGIVIATMGISLAGIALLYGCGGGGNSGGTHSGEFVGRVTSVVNWKMPDDTFSALTPKTRAALLTKGITINDTTKTLTSKELPLAGHWVKIGDRYCMTDADGKFTVEGTVPTSGSVPVLSQMDSDKPEGLVPLNSLVPKGQTPTPVRISLSYSGGQLSRAILGEAGRAQGPDGCSVKDGCLPPGHPDGNKKACCLDYNGPEGDGKPRVRLGTGTAECRSKAVDNYIQSASFEWTFSKGSRPCLGEDGIGAERDAECWYKHRFRNCQNLVEGDRNAAPKIRVPLGGEITFTLRNNTEANSTLLMWTENNVPGSLELKKGVPSENARLESSSKSYILWQYSEARKEFYEDVTLVYKAPTQLPNNQATATYHLTSYAGGLKLVTEIVVGDVDHVELTPVSDTIKVGETTPLTAVAKDSTGKTVNVDFQWSASNGAVSVADSGLVTGKSKGQSVVTVQVVGTELKASSTITVEEDDTPAKSLGLYKMTSANGASLPYIVNEYYDEQLKYLFRHTIFSGSIELFADGKFKTTSKGGEYNYPVNLSGEGTYKATGSTLTLTYTSGVGPKTLTATGAGKLSRYQVYPKDKHFPKDVSVTEIYTLQK